MSSKPFSLARWLLWPRRWSRDAEQPSRGPPPDIVITDYPLDLNPFLAKRKIGLDGIDPPSMQGIRNVGITRKEDLTQYEGGVGATCIRSACNGDSDHQQADARARPAGLTATSI